MVRVPRTKAKGWGFGSTGVSASYEEVISLMDSYIDGVINNKVGCSNCKYIFSRFLKDNPNDKQAVYWIMEDIVSDLNKSESFFRGKSINLEEHITGGRVDLMIVDDANPNIADNIWIEYKWYGGDNTVSKATFIKRDLAQIADITKLQWRMKGQKITKELLINSSGTGWLEVGDGFNALKALDPKQVSKILKDNTLLSATPDVISQAIIYYLKNDANFNLIFK